MFIGFDLHIDGKTELFRNEKGYSYYVRLGEMHLDKQMANYKEDLETYIFAKEIDGTKIQKEWFPEIEADIFISHSHKDKDLACALAGWIYDSFGLKCFIDSCVWGYSDDLLTSMNSELSNKREKEDGYLYDYDSCNRVSQHVNMMLSVALQKMIDKVETVIVLNTENAIKVCSNVEMNKTYSPWIYSEIIATQLLRKKPLITYRNYSRKDYRADSFAMSESMQYAMNISISYKVSLAHLKKLSEKDLISWEMEYLFNEEKYEHCLDALYKHICPEQVKQAKEMNSILNEAELKLIKAYYNETNNDGMDRQELGQAMQRIIYKFIYPCQDCDKILRS